MAEGQILVHSGPLELRLGPIHQTPSTLNLDFDTKPLIKFMCHCVETESSLAAITLEWNQVIKPPTWGLHRDNSDLLKMKFILSTHVFSSFSLKGVDPITRLSTMTSDATSSPVTFMLWCSIGSWDPTHFKLKLEDTFVEGMKFTLKVSKSSLYGP